MGQWETVKKQKKVGGEDREEKENKNKNKKNNRCGHKSLEWLIQADDYNY